MRALAGAITRTRLWLECSGYLQPVFALALGKELGNPHCHPPKELSYGPFPLQPENKFTKSRHLQERIRTNIR